MRPVKVREQQPSSAAADVSKRAGPKLAQRLGENIAAVVDEATGAVVSELVAELERNYPRRSAN